MIPVQFSETITSFPASSHTQDSCATRCSTLQENRCKNCLYASPGLKACHYQDSIVAYINCTKRRYRSTVDYKVTLTPREFGETYFVRPKRQITTYITSKGYESRQKSTWYTNTVVYMKPRLFTNHIDISSESVSSTYGSVDDKGYLVHSEDEQYGDGQTCECMDGYAETGYGSGGDLSDVSENSC